MLLKFGKRDNLEKLMSGKLRLTPASVYQKAEIETGKKGTGDQFDSYLKLRSTVAVLSAPGFVRKLNNIDTQIICQDCANIPMICFYYSPAKHTGDFSITSNDMRQIELDFNHPDSVLIIEDEDSFYKNIADSLGDNIFTSKVTYLQDNILNYDLNAVLKIVNGIPSETPFSHPPDDGTKFYSSILTIGNQNRQFVINRTNSYLTMFFKHHYFKPQQELRMVMPKLLSDVVVVQKIRPIKGATVKDIGFLDSFII
ncbi:hypothetical protein [Pygmaiobacter massiliensis]|uniref:hypothetical protein n=1 Tax=Pygmaiobacter massiliensis TaxID=1917873 RepID=UPI002A800A15|nr:hypothetical protein [Pygmaiobacter massiliensis]MDY4785116.1 hypothetical protein [Pygmaiobacter massiliensis]